MSATTPCGGCHRPIDIGGLQVRVGGHDLWCTVCGHVTKAWNPGRRN